MPLQLSRVDQKILFIAAGVFIALVVAASILVAPDSGYETIPSTYSSGISGAKAAYLLLQETGYPVERWEQPIIEIGSGENKTLILAEPNKLANKEEQAALAKFVKEGGRLIAIGPIAGFFLSQNSIQPNPVEGFVWRKYSALTPSSITRAAPQITMAPRALWTSPSSALALYGQEEKTVVATYSYGKGKVIWWASATPLTNAGLKEPDNLEFFLACLGDKSATRIFWDEYYHGYSRSAKASYENKLTGGILAQLALLATALLLTFSRRSGPLRPSAPEIRLSPLEFVETLGGLYEHAQASNIAVDISYQRFVYWLAKRLGMSAQASVEQLEQAAHGRWQFHDEQFAILLRECASARYLPSLPSRRALQLVRDLHSYAVKFDLFPASAKEPI
jgi:hypothetical protein